MQSGQRHFFKRGRNHMPPDRKDLAGGFNGLFEIARYFKHRQNKKIAEAVSGEIAGLFLKPELKQVAHHRLRVGKRHQTVADIARRRHIELAPQASNSIYETSHGFYDEGQSYAIGAEASF